MSALASEARAAGWHQFAQVKHLVPEEQLLYRSSAPNYKELPSGDSDSTQRLTKQSVDFLTKHKIDSIISFNQYEYRRDERARLQDAKIAYFHLSVVDFTAPSVEQLRRAISFFRGKKATLVHCGYGHGRTGTGVTALQIGFEDGQTWQPYAHAWRANHVETLDQISVLAELRSTLVQGKSVGIPSIGPTDKKRFTIINLATGYYLSISGEADIVTSSPETVETSDGPVGRKFHWDVAVVKDKPTGTSHFTLQNRTTAQRFAIVSPSGSLPVLSNGPAKDGNNLFTIAEVHGPDRGLYTISPKQDANLAVAIDKPKVRKGPALLSFKDEENKFGLWVLYPIASKISSRG